MTRNPDPPDNEQAMSPDQLLVLRPEEMPQLSPDESRLLARHFEIFTETTNKLIAAHQHLQGQVRSLLKELEIKNRELKAVNHELARRMRETEEVKEFLDRVIDSMQTGLVVMNAEGNLTRVNRAARVLLGWGTDAPSRIEDLLDTEIHRIIPHDADWDTPTRSGEIRLRTRDGGTILVRFTAVPIAGTSQNPLERKESLIVFEDLSRLRLLEEKVRRANRLTALGELAAGVAHEMRNPLATMRGFLQLLPLEYEDPAFREECSTRLIREIDRLARLTESLLELSRPIRPEDQRTDLVSLVEEVVAEQREAFQREQVEIILNFEEIPLLPLDRDRIKQVLLNLIINARQAMTHPKRLELTLGTREEIWGSEDQLTLLAVLSVKDNGKGIESRHLDKIFDPFFTTKDEGTGLGLALCHRIVEEHGGVIRVDSTPGKGAAFTLYFPVPGEF